MSKLVTDNQRSGRPVEVYDKEIIDTDQHSTTRDIAEKLDVSHTWFEKRLQKMGYLKKMEFWLPYELLMNMLQRLYERFCQGDETVKCKEGRSRWSNMNNDRLKKMIEADALKNTRELSGELSVDPQYFDT